MMPSRNIPFGPTYLPQAQINGDRPAVFVTLEFDHLVLGLTRHKQHDVDGSWDQS